MQLRTAFSQSNREIMPQNIDYSAYTMYQLYTKPIFGVESYLQEEEYQIHCSSRRDQEPFEGMHFRMHRTFQLTILLATDRFEGIISLMRAL